MVDTTRLRLLLTTMQAVLYTKVFSAVCRVEIAMPVAMSDESNSKRAQGQP